MSYNEKVLLRIKPKLRNIRLRLIALWWFLTRSHYFLFATNTPGTFGRSLTSTNLAIPDMLEYIKRQHGYLDHRELIYRLQSVRLAAYPMERREKLDKLMKELEYELEKEAKEIKI